MLRWNQKQLNQTAKSKTVFSQPVSMWLNFQFEHFPNFEGGWQTSSSGDLHFRGLLFLSKLEERLSISFKISDCCALFNQTCGSNTWVLMHCCLLQGVQNQERHLFLFNDLLLVAKSRAGGNFKLKDKVRVSEMWLSPGPLDEVAEITKSPNTSFILGWPTTNVVATFLWVHASIITCMLCCLILKNNVFCNEKAEKLNRVLLYYNT